MNQNLPSTLKAEGTGVQSLSVLEAFGGKVVSLKDGDRVPLTAACSVL